MTTTTLVTSCPQLLLHSATSVTFPTTHSLLVCLVFCRQHDTPTLEEYFYTDLKECLRGWGGVGRHFTGKKNPETPGTEVIPTQMLTLDIQSYWRPSGWSGCQWWEDMTQGRENSPLGPAVRSNKTPRHLWSPHPPVLPPEKKLFQHTPKVRTDPFHVVVP